MAAEIAMTAAVADGSANEAPVADRDVVDDAATVDANPGREVEPPFGLPLGWRCIEKKYLTGSMVGQAYTRFFGGVDNRHKGVLTIKEAIRREAADRSMNIEEALQDYELRKQQKSEQRVKEKALAKEAEHAKGTIALTSLFKSAIVKVSSTAMVESSQRADVATARPSSARNAPCSKEKLSAVLTPSPVQRTLLQVAKHTIEEETKCCPTCTQKLKWSSYAEGNYGGGVGWECNHNCGWDSTNAGAARWFCDNCENDFCDRCYKVGRLRGNEPEGTFGIFCVDNSFLQAATAGLGLRRSKNLDDKDDDWCASWGTILEGYDDGAGWVQLGNRFLPKCLSGVSVLRMHCVTDEEDQNAQVDAGVKRARPEMGREASDAPIGSKSADEEVVDEVAAPSGTPQTKCLRTDGPPQK